MEIKQHATEQTMDEQRNQRRNKKYLEKSKSGNTTYQNLLDAAKAVLRGQFTVMEAYVKNKQISNKQSNFIPQGIRKEQKQPKVSRKKEITKIRAEINEITD